MAIRFTSGQQSNFEPYDAGTYDLRVIDATQSTSKTGNPQLTVKSEFVGGKYDGKPLLSWYSLGEKSMWKLQALIEATDCPHVVVGQDAQGNPLIEFEESDLIGRVYTADVTVEEYNGKKNNRVNKERLSALAEDEPEPAPAPEPPKAPVRPQATTGGQMARRPRTVG